MAMVKRYWRVVSLLCAAAVVVVGLYVHFSSGAAADASGGSAIDAPSTPAPGTSAVDEMLAYRIEYDVLCGVRQKYSLTDEDLAAYGCEAGQAANLMLTLRQWYVVNGAALAQANENYFATCGGLADVARRVGMGPRDERLLDRQDQLQKDLEALRGPIQQIEQGVKQQIQQQLSASQQIIWRAAMANGGLPIAYRYVPNISEQDRAELHRWLRHEQLARIAANSGREGGSAGGVGDTSTGGGTTSGGGVARPASGAVTQLIQNGQAEQTTRRALMAEKLPAIRDATAAVLPPPPPTDPSLLPPADMTYEITSEVRQ